MRLAGVIHYLWLVKSDIRMPLLYGMILAALLLLRPISQRVMAIAAAQKSQSGETCSRALGFCQPEPGTLRKNKLSLYNLNAAPGIVRDQQIAVQIGVIDQR